MAHLMNEAPSVVHALRWRARTTPDDLAFEFAGESEMRFSYAELDRRAQAVARALDDRGLSGERVLLLHRPGPRYVEAFFGAAYARAVAVPVYPPDTKREVGRIGVIAADAEPALILTDRTSHASVSAQCEALTGGRRVEVLASDELPDGGPVLDPPDLAVDPAAVAFLQYTSGSTGTPKGVMVTHANLVHNCATLKRVLRLGPQTRGVSWLPPYHDMGLIGAILLPVYAGFPCHLMQPLSFVRRPAVWLEAIDRTRATISAAPTFAYAECVARVSAEERARLDLSSLAHALIGAEPVHPSTVDDFARTFAPQGFRRNAFYPCYGLAEATLFVAGGRDPYAGPSTIVVDRAALGVGRAEPAGEGDSATVTLAGCGEAVAPDHVAVVDPSSGRRCPAGRIGEVWVSGPTVAAGYWGRPDSAATFRATLDGDPAASFLRTGDLGFQLGGELFLTGRAKDVIVVRGRNHYAADVEQTAHRADRALRDRGAAFAVDEDGGSRVVLVQEVARGFDPGAAARVEAAIRAEVVREHGLHLSEVVLVHSGSVPRTSSGKVRRDECRRRWRDGALRGVVGGRQAGQPAGAVPYDRLAALVMAALAGEPAMPLGQVPDDVPLTALGLDSLSALRLIVAVDQAYGQTLSIEAILGGATAGDLRRVLAAADAVEPGVSGSPPAIGPADADEVAEPAAGEPAPPAGEPAPPAAQRMWLLDRMGAGGAYHVVGGIRFIGPFEPDRLLAAWRLVITDHPALRVVYRLGDDGTLRRFRAAEPVPEPVRVDFRDTGPHDLAGAYAALDRLAEESIDLETGPLLRATLMRLRPDEWCLGVVVHHIAVDGWSLGLLVGQLGAAYRNGAAFPGETAGDIGGSRRTRPEPGLDVAFWQEYLGNAAPVSPPPDRPPPDRQSWRGGRVPVRLPAGTVQRVRAAAAASGTTPFMVVLAAFGIVLHRWTDQSDMIIGALAANRHPEMADEIGVLVNTLPVRVQVTPDRSVSDVLAAVRDSVLAVYPHQHSALEDIVRAAARTVSGGRAPLVHSVLAWQNLPVSGWQIGELRAAPFELPSPGTQFELALHLTEQTDGLMGFLSYAEDLYRVDTAERIVEALTLVLERALAAPGTKVRDLPLMPAAEVDRLVRTWNDRRAPYPTGQTLPELIATQARATPDALAATDADRSLTYAELDHAAEVLARRLRALEVLPGARVVICAGRTLEWLVSAIAVGKAGAAQVPVDPAQPAARQAMILTDAGPVAALVTRALADRVDSRAPLIEVDVAELVEADPEPSIEVPGADPARPGDAAFVMYTSGSTGRPKGVEVPHSALVNALLSMGDVLGSGPGDVWLSFSSPAFDISLLELFLPLVAGGRVVIAPDRSARDGVALTRLATGSTVTHVQATPSGWRMLLDAGFGVDDRSVTAVTGGENLPLELARTLRARVRRLVNAYGPTETTIFMTTEEMPPAIDEVSIGRPFPNTRAYLLDAAMRPMPVGSVGELYVGGACLANGYLGRPGLTAERFVADPYGPPGSRMYRTGDLCRQLPDGRLVFIGRRDFQVKVRGHRIELGEIEARLMSHPALRAAVVILDDADADPRLIGYVVGDEPDPDELRAHLLAALPAVMVPSAWVVLPRLPLTPNGKLDRAALPRPAAPQPTATDRTGHELDEVADPVLTRLRAILLDVLHIDRMALDEDFFRMGGHSLLAMRAAVRIQAEFGVELPIEELLVGEITIRRLAEMVQRHQVAQTPDGDLHDALEWLSQLTDAEVATLLAGRGHRAR